MTTLTLLVVYCLAIVAASIAGGLVPLWVRLTHTRLQLTISLTAGFMLGVAALHMVPHAVETPGVSASSAMTWLLIGFLTMFFIERFFSFHTHEVAELDDAGKVVTAAEAMPDHDHAGHDCGHAHPAGAHAHGMVGNTPGNKLSWTGAAIGMTLHSVIAGVALASAVASQSHAAGELAGTHVPGAGAGVVAGLAVFLVIVLHKPLDSLTVITLTASAGFAKPTRHLINGLFSLAVPAGVLLFAFGLNKTALAESGPLIGHALAFSAGTFLCIALSDLLPELHFHSHDRGKLSAALLLGVVLAYAVAVAEHSMHDHDHAPAPGSDGHDHGSHGHDSHGVGDDHADHDHSGHAH